jgi:predicted N-acetyltransferase YhbS
MIVTITNRPYSIAKDFHRVSQFLLDTYKHGGIYPNWEESRWQYMHSHPFTIPEQAYKIRLWEDDGAIVGVVSHEGRAGEAFFFEHPDYTCLKPEMLQYAEQNLFSVTSEGMARLVLHINAWDEDLARLAGDAGFSRLEDKPEWVSLFAMPEPFPEITLPQGFRLQSLADENDLHKIHRVMWRGFNHPGEPPEDGIADRAKMQTSPNFRHDLTIVTVAPNGDYASICGMWYEKQTGLAYVEPVATDPTYRRMGLGKAAVLEGIRRCHELGATHAIVGSGQVFYQDIGFKKMFCSYQWVKEWANH